MEDTIGFLLAQLCKAHRNAANDALNEIGLHVGQEMALLRLWQEDGVSQTELADHLCVEAPTATRMLQRLERAGYIERRPDCADARITRVHVTEQGKALRCTVEQTWRALECRLLEQVTLEERLLLRRLLIQMYSNMAD